MGAKEQSGRTWSSSLWTRGTATHRSFSHSPMSENSSGPWKDTFCIPKCRKSLPVPGIRHFTFLPAIKVWPLDGDLAWLQDQNFLAWENVKGRILGTGRLFRHLGMHKISFQGPEESGRLFRHGRGKKSNSKDIMLQHS